MAITSNSVANILRPYVVVRDGKIFLREECVDDAIADLYRNHHGIYSNVIETPGRSKLVVGNLRKKVGKPVFEIYID